MESIRSIDNVAWSGDIAPGLPGRDRKIKRRTSSGIRLHPDSPSGAFDNPLADREPHPGAGIIGSAMETLKDSKDLLPELRFDTDSVILDRKYPLLALQLRGNRYAWRHLAAVGNR